MMASDDRTHSYTHVHTRTLCTACYATCVPRFHHHRPRLLLHRDTLLRFRKFIKLYLLGFNSTGSLQSCLFAAETLEQWRAAVYGGSGQLYDAAEPFPAAAVRFPRLKGGGPLVRKPMGLPDGWLEEARGGGGRAEAQLTDDACEG